MVDVDNELLKEIIQTSKYNMDDWHLTPVTSTYTSGGTSGSSMVHWSTTSTTPTPYNSKEYIISTLVQDGYWVKATGSRVTQDGWTSYSDWDYVVFDPEARLGVKLEDEGWLHGASGREDGSFASLRMGEINLILVKEEDQWKKWIIATNMIKALNTKSKVDRIKVFDGVFGKDKNAEAVLF